MSNRTLSDQVKLLARQIAPDYPQRDQMSDSEHLYAIESSHSGTVAALDGAHRVIRELRAKAGMSAEEVMDLWLRLDATATDRT